MSPKVAEAAIASLARTLGNSSETTVQLSFYGGEPLANWQLVEHAVGYARGVLGDERVSFVLNTNATLVKARHARFLRSAGIDVHVGLDGVDLMANESRRTRTGKPAFERAVRGIERLADAGCRMQLNTVLTPANIDGMERFIDWASVHGIDRIYAAVPDLQGDPSLAGLGAEVVAGKLWQARTAGRRAGVMVGGPWARAVFAERTRIIPEFGESGEIVSLPQISVDGDGRVHWLPFPEEPIGSVEQGTPYEWFKSPAAMETIGKWMRKLERCAACPLLENCKGYLRALSMYHQGSDRGVERQCELALALADQAPAAFGDSSRFSAGVSLAVSGQLSYDWASGQVTHCLRQETFEVDAQDRTLLNRFSSGRHGSAMATGQDDMARIARLLDVAALVPVRADEEYAWLEERLPENYKPLAGKRCIVFASSGCEVAAKSVIGLIENSLDELAGGFLSLPWQPLLAVQTDTDADFRFACGEEGVPAWTMAYVAARRVLVLRKGALKSLGDVLGSGNQALRHELTHILVGQHRFNLPVWFEEGLCEYVSRGAPSEAAWSEIRRISIVPFLVIERIGVKTLIDLDRRPPDSNPYYQHAWAFVSDMATMIGHQRLVEIMHATRGGSSLDTVCRAALGRGLGEMDEQWRVSRSLSEAGLEISRNLVALHGASRSLLYDKVRGGAIRLDPAEAESILALAGHPQALAKLPDRTLATLHSRGLLGLGQQETVPVSGSGQPIVASLRLNLTDRCNMRCGYCYVDHDAARISPMMQSGTAIQALDAFFRNLAPYQPIETTIRFFGGEPLLNWPVIEDALPYIATSSGEGGVRIILNTNATNIRSTQAEKLSGHSVEVVVSVDGVRAVHDGQRRLAGGEGSFDKTAAGIECLLRAGCLVGVAVSVHRENMPHLVGLIDWIGDLQQRYGVRIPVGLNHLSVNDFPAIDSGAESTVVDFIVEAVRHGERQGVDLSGSTLLKPWNSLLGRTTVGTYCSAIGGEVTVHPNGEITPCLPLRMKLGTIDDYEGALRSPAFTRLAARVSGNIPGCAGCDIEAFCAGGCAADEVGGRSMAQMTGDCGIRRSLFRRMVSTFAL